LPLPFPGRMGAIMSSRAAPRLCLLTVDREAKIRCTKGWPGLRLNSQGKNRDKNENVGRNRLCAGGGGDLRRRTGGAGYAYRRTGNSSGYRGNDGGGEADGKIVKGSANTRGEPDQCPYPEQQQLWG